LESFLNRSATGPVSLFQEDSMATRPKTIALKKADPTVGLPLLNQHAAGIDAGSAEHWVAVPPGCDPEPVRSFGSFTAGLHRLADWLTACGVNTVAMESTGIYWIALFQVLEARGFAVHLVDARRAKSLPGARAICWIANGCRSCTPSGCSIAAFGPRMKFVCCAVIYDSVKIWSPPRPSRSNTCRKRSPR
jgi:hypothetical protein